eukprot:5106370-Alexandrium_andersonii.AAC.1
MSASLVGSEMCIRDSVTSSGVTKGVARARVWLAPLGAQSAPSRPRPSYPCLLYTSDAADDM